MAPIAITPRMNIPQSSTKGGQELLGVKSLPTRNFAGPASSTTFTGGVKKVDSILVEDVPSTALPAAPSELQKVVRRMPTLYVIAFFGVVVACAVLIIWNTLQVNRLTSERNKLDDQIAQTEQRLIRLHADEMQLSAQSRVHQIAQDKLGMVEANGDDIIVTR